jgi:hypothetical protein
VLGIRHSLAAERRFALIPIRELLGPGSRPAPAWTNLATRRYEKQLVHPVRSETMDMVERREKDLLMKEDRTSPEDWQ